MTLVLVAEDQAAIGLMLEDELTAAGYDVAGPFSHGSTAMTWLEDHRPDLALLDMRLADGPCIELARALKSRTVPILFFSGLHEYEGLPPDLMGLPWIEKPTTMEALLQALRELPGAKLP